MSDIGNSYNLNEFKKRLKETRIREGLKQEKLAKLISVNRQSIIKWEKGTTIPTLENLVILCKTLDCSMDYLLGSVDTPEIASISKASHYSGISTEIIKYGIEHPDFLDILNFFMHPKYSADIFNSVTLGAWKKFLADSSLQDIKGELKEKLLSFYDEFISITPLEEVSKKTYNKFLRHKLPREMVTPTDDNTSPEINLKKCVSLITYQSFFSGKEFNYTAFINYLSDHTFEPLSHSLMIEIQKNKLANKFVELYMKYLESE